MEHRLVLRALVLGVEAASIRGVKGKLTEL
eukprot:COSAG02_NODE_28648_length_585_cov_1.271605_2_plen_29_part_01